MYGRHGCDHVESKALPPSRRRPWLRNLGWFTAPMLQCPCQRSRSIRCVPQPGQHPLAFTPHSACLATCLKRLDNSSRPGPLLQACPLQLALPVLLLCRAPLLRSVTLHPWSLVMKNAGQARCMRAGPPSEVIQLAPEALPPALEWGEVLVSMRAAPINPADLYSARTGGLYAAAKASPPFFAGQDGVGVLAKVGCRQGRAGAWDAWLLWEHVFL